MPCMESLAYDLVACTKREEAPLLFFLSLLPQQLRKTRHTVETMLPTS